MKSKFEIYAHLGWVRIPDCRSDKRADMAVREYGNGTIGWLGDVFGGVFGWIGDRIQWVMTVHSAVA